MPVIAIETEKIMFEEYRIPTITGYNRLECSPRSNEADTSLKAEIRDALWMLTRQWQFGEFKAEDGGSPVAAVILGEHTPIDRVQLGSDPPVVYDPTRPLEATVEAEKLTDNLFLAVQIARYFIRLLKKESLELKYLSKLILNYPLSFIIDSNDTAGLQLNLAIGKKTFNGSSLVNDIITPDGASTKFQSWMKTEGIPATDQSTLTKLAGNLTDWNNRNYCQPAAGTANDAWEPSQLEYRFALASPPETGEQKLLTAQQFYGGHMDWYSFDLDSGQKMALSPEPATVLPVVENLVSFIPAPVFFKGMPAPRYWTMEGNSIDFGKIDTSATGLLHLLLAEFGLIFSNNWFMLPYPLEVNNICEIKGLMITDVFGDNTMIDPAGSGEANNWQRWSMFEQNDQGIVNNANATVNHLFYLAPATTESLVNDSLEEVNFLRDEMAEMVWAVENLVPSQAGIGVSGSAFALRNFTSPPFVPTPGNAAIRYILGTTVPDNWIPFIPVHIAGSNTEIRFQRAAMPGAKGAVGEILSEKAPYYINEEEIPRSGVLVNRQFTRARWLNGKTFLWIGRTKESGTGEGWSNLQFDQIVPINQPTKT